MSEQPAQATGQSLRTLAVRMPEELRAQLDIVAQLRGRSTTEEIRLALEDWIQRTKSDPALLKKSEAVRSEIEREAETRRNAIAALFGGDGSQESLTKPRTGRGKAATPEE